MFQNLNQESNNLFYITNIPNKLLKVVEISIRTLSKTFCEVSNRTTGSNSRLNPYKKNLWWNPKELPEEISAKIVIGSLHVIAGVITRIILERKLQNRYREIPTQIQITGGYSTNFFEYAQKAFLAKLSGQYPKTIWDK